MSLSIVQVGCMTFALVFVRKSRSKTSKQMRLQGGIRVKAGESPPITFVLRTEALFVNLFIRAQGHSYGSA